MAGKGRASVDDMKRVEVLVLIEVEAHCEDGGTFVLSRKELAQKLGVSPYRARAALDRLCERGLVELVPRFDGDGGQLSNGCRLTEYGTWYLEGARVGMTMAPAHA